MFFLTYLRRELRRRMRQAIFIALGLAIGIGLVITVMGASAGVKTAQAKVLRALYGIGTDVTVTTKPKPPSGRPTTGHANATGPGGNAGHATVCLNGKCYTSGTIDTLVSGDHGALGAATAAKIARLGHVSAAAGGLLLTDNRIVLPKTSSSQLQPPTSLSVDAADIGAVQKEIQHLLPQATVTSSSDLASEVTGSAASAAKLAGALGKWLAVLVLIAAFAVASLLTMAAVARRVPEFGTLKALGWRSGRIVSQVLGESVGTGIIGGAIGVGLGFAGVAIIDKIAPKLSATVPTTTSSGLQTSVAGPGG